MELLHEEIEQEYRKWVDIAGPDDPHVTGDMIGLHGILAAYFLLVDYFAEKGFGIGGVGPRSLDFLDSAISRKFTGYDGARKWSGVYRICATLLFGTDFGPSLSRCQQTDCAAGNTPIASSQEADYQSSAEET